MTDLNKLAEEAYTTAHQRNLNGAKINPDSVIDMLKHCATEVVEATEAYTDLATEAYNDLVDQYRERFQNEIADIVTCCLIISETMQFNLEEALNRVAIKNRKRAEKKGDKL